MNKVILIGRLVRDPELRSTASGVPVCNFTLAVDRGFKNKDGSSETDFIDVVVWRGGAESAAKYLKKGRQAAVDGSLQIRQYEDKDGNKRRAAEVVANRVEFIGSGSGKAKTDLSDIGQEIVFDDGDLPF